MLRKFILHVIQLRWLLILLSVSAILAGCIRTHLKIDPSKPVEYTVIVRADRGWQDSHVRARAGQVIQCTAEGQWSDHFNSYGPKGNADIYKKHFSVYAPANSLIMQVGQHTNISYFIGHETNIVAERSGEIRFRKNYSLPIGMKGEMKVKVKVCADTDADGLADYDEINYWKTDPLNPDSDGDGFNDFDEAIDPRSKMSSTTNFIPQN